MSRRPAFGLGLAAAGALFLTPDALFMRWSEMDGFQMTAWRGLLMGSVMMLGWALLSRDRGGDLAQLASRPGLAIVGCQFLNSTLFCLGIASAPAAVVLFGVAAVPVFSAVLSRVIMGEPTRLATWAAMAAVMVGIGISVSGGKGEEVGLNLRALAGAAFGLGVAAVLALNFVILRARPGLPIPLVIGLGAWAAGLNGLAITGVGAMTDGHPWAMAVTGCIILPVSFFTLSLASRHTQAANVSLLMLLETVLAPLWVWMGVGERPTVNMAIGGAIVVTSLAIYLIVTGRGLRPKQAHG
ncbi:EamA family transporter [Roseovarius salis]|uniref:DMT family transporter n=1 Tax=Roseovarius salis TaxID=3376063 RepID=UPI0037C68B11